MTPVISLVSGTYNRLTHLQKMVASFRAAIPVGIPYEIIIVDGGSADGTLEWARSQSDIQFIEQGTLLGAIKAFDTGAEAATGDYVLLANDDVIFMPNSVLSAITHLETHPQCGAIAFKDDRTSPGYGDGFKVQTIGVIHEGQERHWPYAQVGLFRRWLGNWAGWWGSRDSVMGWKGSTYGGDNFLSSRIYEAGYVIGVLDACRVHDEIPPDGLRARNHSIEQTNPGAYYKRYPSPPVFGSLAPVDNPQDERLRVLYLPIYEKGYGHYKSGLRDAFAGVGLVYELDYINTRGFDLEAIVKDFQPHILLAQCHNSYELQLHKLVAARAAKPDMIAVNWNGDVWEEGLTSEKMLAYLRHFDLVLTVNELAIPVLEEHGIRGAYWQVGFESVDESKLPSVHSHDVVFLANAYSPQRLELGEYLKTFHDLDIGLYGRNWPQSDGYTVYAFDVGRALYKAAKVAISDNQFPDRRGFVSNRLFEALASGVLVLQQRVAGLQGLTGLVAGKHYIEWVTIDDLIEAIETWVNLKDDADRAKIARAGQKYALKHHSFEARVQQLLTELIPMIEGNHATA